MAASISAREYIGSPKAEEFCRGWAWRARSDEDAEAGENENPVKKALTLVPVRGLLHINKRYENF
jgi:hypothetical protein